MQYTSAHLQPYYNLWFPLEIPASAYKYPIKRNTPYSYLKLHQIWKI